MDDKNTAMRTIDDIGGRRAQHSIPPAVPVAAEHDEICIQTSTSLKDTSPRLWRIGHCWLLYHDVWMASGQGL
jgi:hypothetical protein